MATGGISDEENKVQKETMKTSGMKNGMKSYDNDLRYGEDYQMSPDYKKEHSSGDEDEDDEISVGCPSPIQERYAAEASGYKTEDEEEEENDYQRRLSSPPSSVNSNNAHPCSSDEQSSTSTTIRQSRNCSSEDEDSERLQDDDYFKPLKKLKMIQIDKVSYSISGNNRSKSAKRAHQRIQQQQNQEVTSREPSVRRQSLTEEVTSASTGSGVKSFSILDILNHRPSKGTQRLDEPKESVVNTRIVRPWDYGNLEEVAGSSCIPPPAHRGLIPPPPMLIDRFHHRVHHMRPKSADFCSSYDTSTCSSSGRSSTGGSDCCTSPDIINCTVSSPNPVHGASHRRSGHQSQTQSSQRKSSGGGKTQTPLDALFQMTSKTFEELNGESSAEGQPNHLNLFNSRQQPKKKRKSRTAFTNHQIFELEKRFLYQKYLSPADRDEIAAHLGLSNAQVITWFQNRRAKLKRDMEELKKDVESSKILNSHKSFLENVQNLGILKKKSVVNNNTGAEEKNTTIMEK